jgi:methylated-DNA-[protein]-cysteine S-methyltransferase
MSKRKRVSAGEHPGAGDPAYTPPVPLPYGFGALVVAGGRLLAVQWEKDPKRLLASIRGNYPRVRPALREFDGFRPLLSRYAAGDFPKTEEILSLPFAWERVSSFDRRILEAAARITAGETATYGQIAARAGKPGAARAAGGALGRNPWPVLLPCHRVVGADGDLTGFGKGLPAKKALLAFESAITASRQVAQ